MSGGDYQQETALVGTAPAGPTLIRDNSEVLQDVILTGEPYECRLRGAAPVLYVIIGM